jgi:metal transporter CNNM
LKSFLQFHRTGQEPLRDDEISILNGVLELNTKNVETIMTPLKVRAAGPFINSSIDGSLDLTGYSDFECRHDFGSQCGGRNVGVYVYFYWTRPNVRLYNSLLSGYSRFPVHEPGNPLSFIGLLLIKKVVKDNLTFYSTTYSVWFLQALDL